MSTILCSCSVNETHEAIAFDSSARENFISTIDSVNKEFAVKNTRSGGTTMKYVSNACKWVLVNVVADGIGGAAGTAIGGILGGTFGSAIASSGYSRYLEYCKNKMKAPSALFVEYSIPFNVYNDSTYRRIEPELIFAFSDNINHSRLDSIGLWHNMLLNSLSLEGENMVYDNGDVDYKGLLWYAETEAVHQEIVSMRECGSLDSCFFAMCNDMNKILIDLDSVPENQDRIFDIISINLQRNTSISKEDASFITSLARHVVGPFAANITRDNVVSYSKELNKAIKSSSLSRKDILLAKSFYQVAVCSSLYWNTIAENQETNEQP